MCTNPAPFSPPASSNKLDQHSIYTGVQERYGSAAKASNDTAYGHSVATAFGYSSSDLASTPAESNLGLSCGNPFAVANLREGETVVDLGCGAGFDVFQAAKKVGGGRGEGKGRVVGVDMNEDMLRRANEIKKKISADNTSFVESKITAIELPDEMGDCVISNCVINLVPEEERRLVFSEMFRLLKPDGRVAVSDILVKKELEDGMKRNMALYVGCIAGASRVEEYEMYFQAAGFEDILIVGDNSDLNVYKTARKDGTDVECCGPANANGSSCGGGSKAEEEDSELKDIDLNELAGSFKIYAVKPKG